LPAAVEVRLAERPGRVRSSRSPAAGQGHSRAERGWLSSATPARSRSRSKKSRSIPPSSPSTAPRGLRFTRAARGAGRWSLKSRRARGRSNQRRSRTSSSGTARRARGAGAPSWGGGPGRARPGSA